MKKLSLTFFCIFLFNISGISQDQHLIDSLQNKLKQLEAEREELRKGASSLRDSATVKILCDIAVAFMYNDPEKAMNYGRQALTLSEQIGWLKGEAKAYMRIGVSYEVRGNFSEALENLSIALKISEKRGDKDGIGKCYGNIGIVYEKLGNYPEALKNQYASLKIFEKLNDKPGIARAYNNTGSINGRLHNYPEALKNFYASCEIHKKMGNEEHAANSLFNIGIIYSNQGNYPEALKNYLAALKIFELGGDKDGVSSVYNNIGNAYSQQGNYSEGLKYYSAGLKISEEIGDKLSIAGLRGNIGVLYIKHNRVKEGRELLEKGLSVAKQFRSKEIVTDIYNNLSSADSALGNFKGALENYKMFVIYKDSLLNNENTKKITQQQMQYEFDKKEALTKAEQEKKDAVALEEIENQKLVRNGFIGGFATVLIFASTFFRQRNRIKKEKKRSDNLLRNILPDEVAEELKETGGSKAKTHELVSVMFTDFKDFTKISETVSAEMLVEELHTCFSAFDTILHKHNIEKIKTIGDAYMCVSGLPVANESHATDMVKAALEIMDYVIARKREKASKGEFAFELRIGINSGPVVAGIVGLKKFSYDIWGDTVNTAARMENQGESGKINISGTTHELIKEKFICAYRGKITAKNKGEIDMYFVDEPSSKAV